MAESNAFAHDLSYAISENELLQRWDEDIQRGADYWSYRFGGDETDGADLAQAVRLRVLLVLRSSPSAPERYMRKVIANALRTAIRRHMAWFGRTDITHPADTDELVGRSLKPRRHHPPVVVPDGAEALPVAGVAPERPVLDQVPDCHPGRA